MVAISIVTGLRAVRSGVRIPLGAKTFFSGTSNLPVGTVQPTLLLVPGFFPGV